MTADFRIKKLSCGYRNRAVIHDITLPSLQPGTIVALIGPNGAGKSTLLRGLAGLLPVTGSVTLDGQELTHLPPPHRADLIGFMPQGVIGRVGLSVLECVMTALPRHSPDGMEADVAALTVLARLGADDLANRAVGQLSGGQRQAVGLAVAIARDPKLLLLDEPTSALDLARRHMIMQHVRDLTHEGRIAVVVLHDLAYAAQWADRIAILHEGRLFAFGTPDEVLTPDMLRHVYRIDARVERCSAGRLQIMTDGAAPLTQQEARG
ncbi:ABC transporter ATP-binding protein [Paracoccus onubensis]|uniref:ABC transporter ATP-binding protein n=1 Tax=Paracoccus onubensis TaxID=1675788 RepID=UPI0027315AD4|nr:ABC transporter ATP-binding protein [Paracoccus onubensis]MDP0926635.1 ABC transporter ATP-binding protein [Paracoccus onubensis]